MNKNFEQTLDSLDFYLEIKLERCNKEISRLFDFCRFLAIARDCHLARK